MCMNQTSDVCVRLRWNAESLKNDKEEEKGSCGNSYGIVLRFVIFFHLSSGFMSVFVHNTVFFVHVFSGVSQKEHKKT